MCCGAFQSVISKLDWSKYGPIESTDLFHTATSFKSSVSRGWDGSLWHLEGWWDRHLHQTSHIHGCAGQVSVRQNGPSQIRPSQVCPLELSVVHACSGEITTCEICLAEVRLPHITAMEVTFDEVGALQQSGFHAFVPPAKTTKHGPSQTTSREKRFEIECGVSHVGTLEGYARHEGIGEVGATQVTLFHRCVFQVAVFKTSLLQVALVEVAATEVKTVENTRFQRDGREVIAFALAFTTGDACEPTLLRPLNEVKACPGKVSPAKLSVIEVDTLQNRVLEANSVQFGPRKLGIHQDCGREVSMREVSASEIRAG